MRSDAKVRAEFSSGGRRGRRDAAHESEGATRDRWLISYADLVTLLFALFVVLYAAADRERARSVAESFAAQFGSPKNDSTNASAGSAAEGGRGVLTGARTLAAEQSALERAFASNQTLGARTRMKRTERGLVVSLAEAGFFAPGEAEVRADALPLVDALADALRESNAPVRVEGHADSTPISNARYPSNWELSAARASTVLARLRARGIPTARLSVAGYADAQPVADNSTAEGRALNRRVDLVVLSSEGARQP